ncbi:hypothetical protein GCM10027436_72540 [Actinophytocola sediminis]
MDVCVSCLEGGTCNAHWAEVLEKVRELNEQDQKAGQQPKGAS